MKKEEVDEQYSNDIYDACTNAHEYLFDNDKAHLIIGILQEMLEELGFDKTHRILHDYLEGEFEIEE